MKRTEPRSVDQNKLMWQMLTDWAEQDERYTLEGERLDAHDFKELLMAGFKRETRLTPSLDGKGVVFLSRSTSRLSKDQMTQFIIFIEAEGLMRGIVFRHIPPDPIESPQGPSGGKAVSTTKRKKASRRPSVADCARVPRNSEELMDLLLRSAELEG